MRAVFECLILSVNIICRPRSGADAIYRGFFFFFLYIYIPSDLLFSLFRSRLFPALLSSSPPLLVSSSPPLLISSSLCKTVQSIPHYFAGARVEGAEGVEVAEGAEVAIAAEVSDCININCKCELLGGLGINIPIYRLWSLRATPTMRTKLSLARAKPPYFFITPISPSVTISISLICEAYAIFPPSILFPLKGHSAPLGLWNGFRYRNQV